jgi:hypothetical protein
MNRKIFRLSNLFTVLALTIFAFSPEPSKLIIVVLPLTIFFPVAIHKRSKTIDMNLKNALMAYVPVRGRKQLRALYLAKP